MLFFPLKAKIKRLHSYRFVDLLLSSPVHVGHCRRFVSEPLPRRSCLLIFRGDQLPRCHGIPHLFQYRPQHGYALHHDGSCNFRRVPREFGLAAGCAGEYLKSRQPRGVRFLCSVSAYQIFDMPLFPRMSISMGRSRACRQRRTVIPWIVFVSIIFPCRADC